MERNIIRIGNIADIGRGSSPRPITDKKYFENGEIPWVKIADATASGKYIYETKEYVNELGASYSRKMKPGTLILSASGVSLGIPHFLGVEGCIHDGWIYMDNIHDIDKQYLYYLLLTMRPYFDNLSYGAAIQNINTPILSKTKIEVPNIQSQEKVGLMLSTYDNFIENTNKRISLLEQIAENLYKEWFVRFRFPGYEDAEFENGAPKNWEYSKLINFIDVRYGKDHKSIEEGTIPILGSGGIMRYGDRALYNGEAVLIPRKGSLNNIMYINGEFWTVDTLFYSIPKIKNIARYLYFTFKYIDMESLNSGVSIPSMTTDIIYHLKMRQPDATVLEKFDEVLKPIYEEIDLLGKRNDNIKKQRDMLLPRLMSGKLEV